jgi:hypothetical protein
MSRPRTRISAWPRPFAPHVTRPLFLFRWWGGQPPMLRSMGGGRGTPSTASGGGTSTGVGWLRSGIARELGTSWSRRTTHAEPLPEAGAQRTL